MEDKIKWLLTGAVNSYCLEDIAKVRKCCVVTEGDRSTGGYLAFMNSSDVQMGRGYPQFYASQMDLLWVIAVIKTESLLCEDIENATASRRKRDVSVTAGMVALDPEALRSLLENTTLYAQFSLFCTFSDEFPANVENW